MKAFTDDKINVTEKLKFVWGRIQNIVGKRENAGYQPFSEAFFFKVVRSRDCVVRVNRNCETGRHSHDIKKKKWHYLVNHFYHTDQHSLTCSSFDMKPPFSKTQQ